MSKKALLSSFIFLFTTQLFSQQAKVDFKKDVWPIIERSCVECHRVPHKNNEGKLIKPKAGLILEHANGIMQGTRDGKVVLPGKPERSTFYTLTVLPDEDDDKMPSKGDPLTKKESDLISRWILEGAHFGDWEGAKDYTPGTVAEQIKLAPLKEEKLAESLKALPENVLLKARQSKASIQALSVNFPMYDVIYVEKHSGIHDRDFNFLMPIKKHVARLDASHTNISSNSFKKLQGFSNLVRLNLRETKIQDADLIHLAQLKHLETLNLFSTKVSNAGILHLKGLKNLKHLHLRGTKVNQSGAKKLLAYLPKLDISFGSINAFNKNNILNTYLKTKSPSN